MKFTDIEWTILEKDFNDYFRIQTKIGKYIVQVYFYEITKSYEKWYDTKSYLNHQHLGIIIHNTFHDKQDFCKKETYDIFSDAGITSSICWRDKLPTIPDSKCGWAVIDRNFTMVDKILTVLSERTGEDKIMANNTSDKLMAVVNTTKNEFVDGAWRTAAQQTLNTVRTPLLNWLS